MADLTVQSVGPSGSDYTTTSAASGGDALPMADETSVALIVENTSGATETVTLVSQASASVGLSAQDETLDVASNSTGAFWLETTNVRALLDGDEKVQITYTDNTAFELAAIKQ